MSPSKFQALRDQAVALFKAQPAKPVANRITLDAIFIALAADCPPGAAVRKTSEDPPPAWFTDTLDNLRKSGEAFTVTRLLVLAGRFPATRRDQVDVGRWLREEGMTPRKTGGQYLFEFAP